jgi:S1-C subfamily serine protease
MSAWLAVAWFGLAGSAEGQQPGLAGPEPVQPGNVEAGIGRHLADLKAATVFIRVETDRVSASGSGFLIRVDAGTGLVVTNNHVIDPEGALPAPGRARAGRGRRPAVTLVFHSGTRQEFSTGGEIVARDVEHDLAVVRVRTSQPLPRPIELGQPPPLVETLPVYVFGFPFGKALASNRRNPEITVGKGSVSSIRRDEREQITGVQIDGALNPGNSGGPVVDADGRLVGVAVAAIRGANIGMAIPSPLVTAMLDGSAGRATLTLKKIVAGQASVEVEVPLIDPLERIGSISFLYLRAEKIRTRLEPDEQGQWRRLVGATEAPLTIQRPLATAVIQVNGINDRIAVLLVQVSYNNGSDKRIYTRPERCRLSSVREPEEMARDGVFPDPLPFRPFPSAPTVTQIRGGRPSPPREPRPLTLPQPAAVDQSLVGSSRVIGDLRVAELKLDASAVPPCLCWSADGRAFFALDDQTGTVRRFLVDGLVEQRRLETRRKCSWLSPSAAGLLLAVPELEEVWILDQDSLKVRGRIVVPGVSRAVSAPAAWLGVALGADDTLFLLDLKKQQGLKEYNPRSFPGVFVAFAAPAMTPDGRYVFTQGGAGELVRFLLDGTDLLHEQSGPPIVQGRAGECALSADSRYICLPSTDGNRRGLVQHPKVGPFATYVYRVTDLGHPAFALEQGASPSAVAFDFRGGYVPAGDATGNLILFNLAGVKRKEYHLGGEIRQIVPHAAGRKLLVLAGGKLLMVETPKR